MAQIDDAVLEISASAKIAFFHAPIALLIAFTVRPARGVAGAGSYQTNRCLFEPKHRAD